MQHLLEFSRDLDTVKTTPEARQVFAEVLQKETDHRGKSLDTHAAFQAGEFDVVDRPPKMAKYADAPWRAKRSCK